MTPGPLYRICAHLLMAIPVDHAGRRVFDETLADWRREAVTLRGFGGVGRAIVWVATREAVSAETARVWLNTAGWLLGLVGVSLGAATWVLGWPGVSAVAAGLVAPAAFLLPTALLCSTLRRRAAAPAGLGMALTAVVVGVLITGWVLPVANSSLYAGMGLAGLGDAIANGGVRINPDPARAAFMAIWPIAPPQFLSEHHLFDVVGQLAARAAAWESVFRLNWLIAYAVTCGFVVLSGMTLRGRRRLPRIAGGTVAVACVLYPERLTHMVAELAAPDPVLWFFVWPWVPVVALALLFAATAPTRPIPPAVESPSRA